MEEGECTLSMSPATALPPVSSGGGNGVVPLAVNMAVNMSSGASPAVTAAGGGGVATVSGGRAADLLGKKKRGRPRKYDADGNLRLPYISPSSRSPTSGFSLSPPSSGYSKKGRGRPTGSGNWQLLASLGELFANTAGGDFTPHVVTVNTGEDVAAKILSFSQKGPRGVCILAANGAVSNVTIRQPGSAGGLLTFEGRFEILSLTGSFTVSESGGMRSRTGGLSVSLAGPDGRVIGGGIAGLLVAASPIQIVVGSFMPNGYKAHKRKHQYEPRTSTPDTVTPATPISQAPPESNFFLNPTSQMPLQSHGGADNSTNDKKYHDAASDSAEWKSSEPSFAGRPSPDINLSVPLE